MAEQERKYSGMIKDFPEEVVEKMLDEQERQTGKRDKTIFEEAIELSLIEDGGFNWDASTDGYSFWEDVIIHERFDVFFQRYPKSERDAASEVPKPKFEVGDIVRLKSDSTKVMTVDSVQYGCISKQWIVFCRYLSSDIKTAFYESQLELCHDEEADRLRSLLDFREQIREQIGADLAGFANGMGCGIAYLPTSDIVDHNGHVALCNGTTPIGTLIISPKNRVLKVNQDI